MRLEDINNTLLIWGPLSEQGIGKLKEEKSLVVVPENRPYLIGIKHNTFLLKQNNVPFVYCTDNMLGFLFYKKKIRKTLLFYKESKKEGVICVCGSLYVALLSRLHGVPIELFPQGSTSSNYLDEDASTLAGKKVILDGKENFVEKPTDELISWEILCASLTT